MKAFVFGLVMIAASVVVILPQGLNRRPDVLAFLRGGLPVLSALLGCLALLIGAADLKDRFDAKKDADAEKKDGA
jgi:hypothetical protein